MTEAGCETLERDASSFRFSRTTMRWLNDRLVIEFDEATQPFFQRMRPRLAGRVEIDAGPRFDATSTHKSLDPAGRHRWRPIAPHGRARVVLEDGPSFEGPAYVDENAGDEGLEQAFRGWSWSRSADATGTDVVYDVTLRDGTELAWNTRFHADGSQSRPPAPQRIELGRAGWGVQRPTRSPRSACVGVQRTLVDAPFYARSLLVRAVDAEEPRFAMHESLDIDRFEAPWVRFLLPWRIKRAA